MSAKNEQLFAVLLKAMWYTQEGGGTRHPAGVNYFGYEIVTGGKLPSSAVILPDDDYLLERNEQIIAANVAANAEYDVYLLTKAKKKVPAALRKLAAGPKEIPAARTYAR